MANQFLWRTIADPERCPSWYLSGMAEEFSCHRWDGRVFQHGVHDLIDLSEPFAALENQARSGVFDLAAVVEGRRAEDPMSSFAAVDFFCVALMRVDSGGLPIWKNSSCAAK